MLGTTESRSVFEIIKLACLELADVSFKIYGRVFSVQQLQQDGGTRQRPLYPNFCYSRMMWSEY